MKAQVIKAFGDPSVFILQDMEIPVLKAGQVLVKVAASSVNQIDCKIRAGLVPGIAPDFPAILHGDLAGTIVDLAADVKDFEKGNEVFACAGGLKGSPGALAEYCVVDRKLLAKKPKTLSMLQAAALPLVSITAWEALFIRGNLQKGQQVLIHGGVGGVGHIALQLAKYAGAKVTTTVLKPEDFPLCKALGADDIINAKEESVEAYVNRLTQAKGFDLVFDTVGGNNIANSFQAAKTHGSVVTIAARSTQDLSPMHSKALSLHAVFMLLPILQNEGREAHGEILKKIAKIVDEEKLKPLIDPHTFLFKQVSDAHQHLESGKAQGKVVIQY